MKIMTILGTRPEIIRLCLIIEKLDIFCNHILVHTGQNYDYHLNELFFNSLGVRKPDYFLEVKGKSFGEQIGKILIESEKIILKEKPDAILILGDTNSGLTSIIAKRLGVFVYHLEAGNRCYDDRVPEEVNRRIIDHSSDIFMPYTNRSKDNLVREGIPREKIYIVGNPIFEVIRHYEEKIDNSDIITKLGLEANKYLLVTMHRAENVDISQRLQNLIYAFELLFEEFNYPIICSLHPRTKDKIQRYNITTKMKNIHFLTPLDFFDFVKLEKNATLVLTDSGTVQEECCIFNKPNITIRDVTERPETIEVGSNLITGNNPQNILSCAKMVIKQDNYWKPPDEYIVKNVSETVLKIIFSFNENII